MERAKVSSEKKFGLKALCKGQVDLSVNPNILSDYLY